MGLTLQIIQEQPLSITSLSKIYQSLEESFTTFSQENSHGGFQKKLILKEIKKNGLYSQFDLMINNSFLVDELYHSLISQFFVKFLYTIQHILPEQQEKKGAIIVLEINKVVFKSNEVEMTLPEIQSLEKFLLCLPDHTEFVLTSHLNHLIKLRKKRLHGTPKAVLPSTNTVYAKRDMKYINLAGQVLSRHNFSESNLTEANLSYTNLSYGEFFNAKLIEVDLTEANLSYSDLFKADLTEAKLIKSNLDNTNLFKAALTEADLSYASVKNSIVISAQLNETNLTGADLSFSNLYSVNLTESIMQRTHLYHVNLHNANLTETDLSGSDLEGAILTGVCLTDAKCQFSNWWQAQQMDSDLFSQLQKYFPVEENYMAFAQIWHKDPESIKHVTVQVQ